MNFNFQTKVVTIIFLVIALLLYLFIFKYTVQEEVNKELIESVKILQVQQENIISLLVESDKKFQKDIDTLEHNLIVTILSFSSCVERRKLNITHEYILEAIQQLCSPPQLNFYDIFEDKNNIFLECIVEKGKSQKSLNIKRLEDECTEYEVELSEQISHQIQNANN